MKIVRLLIRLLCLPLWSGIILIAALRDWIYTTIKFARFGGEAITFKNSIEKETIKSKLDKLINEKH